MLRTLIISTMVCCFIAGTGQSSHSVTTYECKAIPPPPANCTVDDGPPSDNPNIISCRPAGGVPPFEVSCRVKYTPLQGVTWTGSPGYDWLCGTDIIVPNSEFQNKKAMCDKFCGTCDSGWK